SFFYWCGPHPDLHSFPTRRSSDLVGSKFALLGLVAGAQTFLLVAVTLTGVAWLGRGGPPPEYHLPFWPLLGVFGLLALAGGSFRSGEHTSELQSLTNIVCPLLLEQ